MLSAHLNKRESVVQSQSALSFPRDSLVAMVQSELNAVQLFGAVQLHENQNWPRPEVRVSLISQKINALNIALIAN